ncbi:transposase [Burkholderia latens]|uniref:transposase n=1 Tax=Burkholderia latens TaxID=488446 RepID=UPI0024755C17|nr:transposase [Burkholderia latens]
MNRIPRAVYTKELRDEAVKLALAEGVGVSEASRRLSIPIKTLANWVRAAKAGKLTSPFPRFPCYLCHVMVLPLAFSCRYSLADSTNVHVQRSSW